MEIVDEWWIFSAGMLVCAAISESSLVSMIKCSTVPMAALLPKVLPLQQYTHVNATVVVGAAMGLYFLFRACKGKSRERRMSFMTDTLVAGPFPPRVEAPDPIIGTVLYFDKLPSVDAIKNVFRVFLNYERFTCYPKQTWFGNRWTKPEHFDYDKHFVEVRTHNDQQLLQYIDEALPKKIRQGDKAPQWEVHIITNTRGKSAILVRISHIVGDGVSFVTLMDKVFQDQQGHALNMGSPISRPNAIANKAGRGTVLSLVGKVVKATLEVLQTPASAFDTKTAFSARPPGELKFTPRRHAVQFPVLNLGSIKAIKDAANVTVNDVMVTAMAGCIRRYCIAQSDPAIQQPGVRTRSLIPVAFGRSKEETDDVRTALRNRWCLVSADMHVNEPDSKKRLLLVCQTMTTLKTTPVAPITMFFQDHVLHRLPRFFQQKTGYDTFVRHSLVFSNVPGPQEPMYFANEQLIGIQVLYPNLLPQVIALSYNGGIYMNLVVDPEMIRNSDDMPKYFIEELVELARGYKLTLTADDMLLTDASIVRRKAVGQDATSATSGTASRTWKGEKEALTNTTSET